MPPRRAANRVTSGKFEDGDSDVPTRRKRVATVVDSEDENEVAVPSEADSDESDHKPAKKPVKKTQKAPPKRAPSKATGTSSKARAAAKALAGDDGDEDEEPVKVTIEDIIPKKPAPKARAKGKSTKTTKEAPLQTNSRAPSVIDSELDEPLDTTLLPNRTPRPSQKKPGPVALDEEENIVLETLETPRRPAIIFSPVKPEPEESKGPKPRLVIHKIVLVNFKSYAGRAQIGPFHKVSPIRTSDFFILLRFYYF
jgi:structural maintenance of chromosome 4